MKKLLCLVVLLALALTGANAFTLPPSVMEEALKTSDFEAVIANYFMPSLSPREAVVFCAELNISNGRPNLEFGERYMFGRLESAGSAARMEYPEILSERAADEALRLLFGPWVKPGKTEMKLLRRTGLALDLKTGEWRPYSGPVIFVRHITEHFGGLRTRFLALAYDGAECRITVVKVK
jgi:hypothetical protein